MRKGQRVETLTKTTGQTPRSGIVVDIRDKEFVEVEWDDGHISMISQTALTPSTSSKPSEDTSD